jgi:hypothetical protein
MHRTQIAICAIILSVYTGYAFFSIKEITCPILLDTNPTIVYRNSKMMYQHTAYYCDKQFYHHIYADSTDQEAIQLWLQTHPTEQVLSTTWGILSLNQFTVFFIVHMVFMLICCGMIMYLDILSQEDNRFGHLRFIKM